MMSLFGNLQTSAAFIQRYLIISTQKSIVKYKGNIRQFFESIPTETYLTRKIPKIVIICQRISGINKIDTGLLGLSQKPFYI